MKLAPWSLSLPAVAMFALGIVEVRPAEAAGPLAHSVAFTLKDRSKESREAMVAACQKYLTGHPGVTSFVVGTIAEDVVEPAVSDRDFDVTIHMVFRDKAAAAEYLKSPRHVAFVSENKGAWSRVRVFDSYLAPAEK